MPSMAAARSLVASGVFYAKLVRSASAPMRRIENNAKMDYIRPPSGDFRMITSTVTARGQAAFRKDVLHHLGIRPGEKIELNKLPEGRITL